MSDVLENNLDLVPEPKTTKVTADVPTTLAKDLKMFAIKRDTTLTALVNTALANHLQFLISLEQRETQAGLTRYPKFNGVAENVWANKLPGR